MIFTTTAFKYLVVKFYYEPCLAISMPQIVGLSSQLVANPSRSELNDEFIIWCFATDDEVDVLLLC
jgi:hypothetical protein